MIRLGTHKDALSITELVIKFLTEDNAYTSHTTQPDREHIYSMITKLLHIGYVWVYETDQRVVGVLIAVKEPNLWYPDKVFLKEMIYYVEVDYRTTLAGGKLFVAYMKEGARLLKENNVVGYTATSMETTTKDYNLEKRGFTPKETLYMKEI
jgi:hypothetical protein